VDAVAFTPACRKGQLMGPIKPEEAFSGANIPEEVFEAFNELIQQNMGTVCQDEVVSLIMKKMTISRDLVFKNGWLHVEEAYRRVGWEVEYDKPGYNETYPATFHFRVKKKVMR